ncbi:MAG: HDOD domain-containing protein [Pseudomonadota bacterium]|nr:HDOD domain-containing protein [Pseudomonadota bacterium]
MALPHAVKTYLDASRLPYRLVPHPRTETLEQTAQSTQISPRRLVRVVVLRDAQGLVTAILPTSHILDFSQLCTVTERELDPLYGEDYAAIFHDCEPGSHPPLPEVFGLRVALMDNSLAVPGEIFFEAGSHDVLVAMASEHFQQLLGGQILQAGFAHPVDALGHLSDHSDDPTQGIVSATSRYLPIHLKGGVEPVRDLPALPETVRLILDWQANPKDDVEEELAQIIDADALLARLILHWARSPYYGQRQPVDSVRDAIRQVLGFDLVMHLALGISIGRTCRIPPDGPLGLRAHWRHAVYCTALVGRLIQFVPQNLRPRPGLAQLGALLHNFGLLLLGHLFPAQFFLLNRFVAVNAHLPVDLVERYVLGAEHPHIGGWLIQAWQLPREVIAALRWHHREDYSLPYTEYSNLVLIANRLLRRHRIGDEGTTELPTAVMSSLGLTAEQAMTALAELMARRTYLDELAWQLAMEVPQEQPTVATAY